MKKQFFKKIFLVLLILLTFVKVNAEVAFSGETVNQEGQYDSTIFVAGNDIKDTSTADGLKFIAGNTIDLKGTSPYAFYAGNLVTINSNIEKDLFAAGNSITIGSDAVLGRDVYLAGNTIKLNTNVTRNLNAGGSSIDIKGITINGNANLYFEEILLDENTVIEGKLVYPKDSKVVGLDVAKVSSVEVKDTSNMKVEVSLADKIWSFVISVFAGFIVLIALFRFIPSSREKLDKLELSLDNFAKRGCTGIIVLIVVPLISLFALVSGILTPIAIITLLVYGVSIYVSFLVIAYLIGRILFTRLIKNDNIYLMMLCGILVLKILQIIPAVGGFVSAIALFCGLGFIYKFITNKTK